MEETLTVWDAKRVEQLIAQRLAETPISFTSAETEQILQETGGHPQKVMLACFRLYNTYRDRLGIFLE